MSDAPPMARDATGVALVFIATCLVTASIVETRVLVPVFPLLAPAALHFATTQTGSHLKRPPKHHAKSWAAAPGPRGRAIR